MKRLSVIPASTLVASAAVAGSLALHSGFVLWQSVPTNAAVEVAGGGGGQMAVQGTAFADLAQGVSHSVPVEPAKALTPVSTTKAVVATAKPVTAPVTASAAVAPQTPAPVAAPQAPLEVAKVPADALASIEETTPRISARPNKRPAVIEEQAEARAAKARAAKRSAAKPKPRGNAKTNATRGTAGGSKAGKATASGSGKQRAVGNAAASNYPGQVQRRIARQRLPRVRARGIARVTFSISGSGGLASLRLSRSSGSAELDREALKLVKRAAPFPAPPAGAQRSFTIPVRAR